MMNRLRSLTKLAASYSQLRSVKLRQRRKISTSCTLTYKWEPDGLEDKLKPPVPIYDLVYVKLQGYDYPVLESFQQFVSSKARILGIDSYCFPVPAKKTTFQTLQFNSNIVTDKIDLSYCERVIELRKVNTLQIPILLELICPHTPEGVDITVKEPTPEEVDYIYVPNQEKQQILEMMDDITERKA
ncbi:28S ribosomal protein S10 [Mactra antiquata]